MSMLVQVMNDPLRVCWMNNCGRWPKTCRKVLRSLLYWDDNWLKQHLKTRKNGMLSRNPPGHLQFGTEHVITLAGCPDLPITGWVAGQGNRFLHTVVPQRQVQKLSLSFSNVKNGEGALGRRGWFPQGTGWRAVRHGCHWLLVIVVIIIRVPLANVETWRGKWESI